MDITPEQVRAHRLRAHHLDRRYPASRILEAAGACGLQNSPPGGWETALFQRLEGCSLPLLRDALYRDRALLQAWSIRGVPLVFPAGESGVFLSPLLAREGECPWIYTRGITAALDFVGMSFDEAHTRVREDLYRRPARPELFPAILAASRTPLCYNGDLVTAADCRAFSVRFPGAGLMMGRGLVADPALASKAKGGPGADRDTLRAFHDALYEGYARDFGSRRNAMLRMKELWSYLIHLFRDPESYAKKLRKAADPAEFEALTAGMFRELELPPGLEPGFLF